MRTRLNTLDLMALAAVACYVLSVLPFIPRDVSNVAGTVLCFMITGIIAASALLRHHVGILVRFTAVIACSLGAGIIGGLLLNFLPSGLIQFNWVTYALATSLIAYGVARARGAGSPLHWKRTGIPIPSWPACVKVLASIGIVTAAIVISINSTNANEKTFTELWLVPDSPLNTPLHATRAVLGIRSHESSTQDYTVVMDTGEETLTSRVTLAPNQVWTQAVPVKGAKASASVYKGSVTDRPYRRVWIVTQ
jgi:hypothetical protein